MTSSTANTSATGPPRAVDQHGRRGRPASRLISSAATRVARRRVERTAEEDGAPLVELLDRLERFVDDRAPRPGPGRDGRGPLRRVRRTEGMSGQGGGASSALLRLAAGRRRSRADAADRAPRHSAATSTRRTSASPRSSRATRRLRRRPIARRDLGLRQPGDARRAASTSASPRSRRTRGTRDRSAHLSRWYRLPTRYSCWRTPVRGGRRWRCRRGADGPACGTRLT